jgi:hypothetical protein
MRYILHRRWYGGLALVAILSQLVGCGGPAAPKREYADVVGTVKYKGKALVTGTVMFQPPNGAMIVSDIKKDGTYSLKGVIGPNIVTIVSQEEKPPMSAADPKSRVEPKSHIPEIYGTPASELKFVVKAGQNKADFDLK